ncbi:MAG TPA: hypothetical protein PK616_05610, partial [Fibrobacteraceae bacterium]|nr:hypothetical protein [Fibrobacteraceae bacterium]
LNSISRILELDYKEVLSSYLKEKGSPDYAEQQVVEKETAVSSEREKKSFLMPIIVVVLGLAFFVLMNFVNQFEKTEESVSNNPLMKESSVAPQDSEESVESSTLIHDGAELVVLDSLVRDSLVKDSLSSDSIQAVVDTTAVDTISKKKELPASATIFISSSSKEKVQVNTKNTSFVLIGSGVANSWVGLKRNESDTAFLKEANISREGGKLVYETSDTLYVIIGDPVAIAKMTLNGKETALPKMKNGLVTRFRVFNGQIIPGVR